MYTVLCLIVMFCVDVDQEIPFIRKIISTCGENQSLSSCLSRGYQPFPIILFWETTLILVVTVPMRIMFFHCLYQAFHQYSPLFTAGGYVITFGGCIIEEHGEFKWLSDKCHIVTV